MMSYKKLWKRLIDLNMSKGELAERAGISGSTLARMKSGKMVSMTVLLKISSALGCEITDIMDEEICRNV